MHDFFFLFKNWELFLLLGDRQEWSEQDDRLQPGDCVWSELAVGPRHAGLSVLHHPHQPLHRVPPQIPRSDFHQVNGNASVRQGAIKYNNKETFWYLRCSTHSLFGVEWKAIRFWELLIKEDRYCCVKRKKRIMCAHDSIGLLPSCDTGGLSWCFWQERETSLEQASAGKGRYGF